MPTISVLMPAYNEEKNLEKAVKETMRELKGLDYEIIIINDGSKDNTLEVAKRLCESFRDVKLV
ncbi:glycosyltransferase, partial [Thermococcus sp. M39]|uniref:glycosyltransferase family 2 protein n=1 Tax=Thermococcus sp. M39 TaxID=1638262 RepID=UPI00143B1813